MCEGIGECILSRKDIGWCADDYCHRFEPRYDERVDTAAAEALAEAIKNPNNITGDIMTSELVAELKDRTYVHDVCTKCGAVVQRGE